MPDLPLGVDGAYARTRGIMLFPGKDEQEKASAIAAKILNGANSRAAVDGVMFPLELYREISQLDGGVMVNSGDLKTRVEDGLIVGQLTQIYFALARQSEKKASWKNALRLLEIIRETSSASRFYEAKARLAPVAHLWGALVCRGSRLKPQPQIGYTMHDDFHTFIEESEVILAWGTEWRQERAKTETPFPAEAMWRAPTGWTRDRWNPEWKVPDHLEYTLPDNLIAGLNPPGRKRRST